LKGNFAFFYYNQICKRGCSLISEKLWQKVARNFINAGVIPFTVNDTLLEILKLLITEEQAKLLLIFRKRSLNIDQIRAKTELDEEELNKMLNELMYNGIILGLPSSTTGIMVYYLNPPLPGLFEYPFMKGETGERQKKLAELYDRFFDDMAEWAQPYDEIIATQFKNSMPIDRVIPVEEEVEPGQETVLPYEDIIKIIEKNDIISANHCYCRIWKENLNDPCKLGVSDIKCLNFGKAARFLIDYEFGIPISKEDAINMVKKAEDYGLVHKAFHIKQNPELDETTICSCCTCCCQTFQIHKRGIFPFYTFTSYIANVDEEKCKGCGICLEKCPVEAVELINNYSIVNKDRCIGCGLCAHHCPEKARSLERTGLRKVFISAPKLAKL
ncbi:MAG: ATP-binding protein, partial [Promethearchaeota archaeon]